MRPVFSGDNLADVSSSQPDESCPEAVDQVEKQTHKGAEGEKHLSYEGVSLMCPQPKQRSREVGEIL